MYSQSETNDFEVAGPGTNENQLEICARECESIQLKNYGWHENK
jgi:hypothetical protein